MSNDQKPAEKPAEEKETFSGVVIYSFTISAKTTTKGKGKEAKVQKEGEDKKYNVGDEFSTENESLYKSLISKRRIK